MLKFEFNIGKFARGFNEDLDFGDIFYRCKGLKNHWCSQETRRCRHPYMKDMIKPYKCIHYNAGGQRKIAEWELIFTFEYLWEEFFEGLIR